MQLLEERVYLHLTASGSLLRECRVGTQSRNLRTGTSIETMEEYCWLPCIGFLSFLFCVPKNTRLGRHHLQWASLSHINH